MRYRSTLVTLLAVLLASCETWRALPRIEGLAWRGRQAFEGEHATLLAIDPRAAAEIDELLSEVTAAFTGAIGRTPGRGVVIVVDAADPLLLPDATALMKQLAQWYEVSAGAKHPSTQGFSSPAFGGSNGKDALQPDPQHMARIPTVRVPKDAFDLPDAVSARGSWVAVVPTEACFEQFVDAVYDQGMERVGIMQAIFVGPWLASKFGEMRKTLVLQRAADVHKIFSFELEADNRVRLELLVKTLKYAELIPKDARVNIDEPRRPFDPFEYAKSTFRPIGPKPGMRSVHSSSFPSSSVLLPRLHELGFPDMLDIRAMKLRSNLTSYPDLKFDMRDLPIDWPSGWTRENAMRLGTVLDEYGTRPVLVFGRKVHVAAMLTLLAYFYDKKTVAEALAIGDHYGLEKERQHVRSLLR